MEDDLPPPPPPGAGAQDYDDDDYEDDPYPDDLPPIPPVGFAPEPERETKIVSPLKAWIGLFLIMVLTGLTGFVFQKDIMVAYPPSMKVYSMLGITPDILGHGLEFPSQPLAEHELVGEKRQLIVSGEIVNTTDSIKEVPTLKGELLNAQGETLYIWTFEVGQKEVLPGEAGKYETRVETLPRGATGIKVTFISPDELEELRMLRGDSPMEDGMEKKDGNG